MGCLFVLITALSPRLGIILLWVFTNYVNAVFSTWIWPLLGLIVLPWTTLMYILVAAPVGGISFWGWLMVGLGVVMDISSHGQEYTNRDQAMSMYRWPANHPGRDRSRWLRPERVREAAPRRAVAASDTITSVETHSTSASASCRRWGSTSCWSGRSKIRMTRP